MGVELQGRLGYLATCAPPVSSCSFPSPVIDAVGPQNDLLDCLACQIEDRLRSTGVLLFADGSSANTCQGALGRAGLGILELLVDHIHRCLERGQSESIAGCLADPALAAKEADKVEAWRASAESECRAVDPFRDLGYPTYCGGVVPDLPPFCGQPAPSCAFPAISSLSQPGVDNDLLDCLRCQVEEAALDVARALYGAEICCTSEGCRSVRSRIACRRAGGAPALYLVDSFDAGLQLQCCSHGIAVGADGTIYSGDTEGKRVVARSPTGVPSVVGTTPGYPFGVAVDQSGNVYAALRSNNQVVRIGPDGATTPFAGTGAGAHSGDGGPAVDAAIAAPNGVAVDERGRVYLTESGAIDFFFTGTGFSAGEHIRVVDPTGTIETFAGRGPFGDAGVGGPALAADLAAPYQLAALADGGLLIGEVGTQRVLRVDPDGVLRLVAGQTQGPVGAYSGDGGPAMNARLNSAEGVGVDSEGKTFIADLRNKRIRMVDSLGTIVTVVGTGQRAIIGVHDIDVPPDGTPGTFGNAGCPAALAVGTDDRVYYAELGFGRVHVLKLVEYASVSTMTTTTSTTTSTTATTSSSSTTTTFVTYTTTTTVPFVCPANPAGGPREFRFTVDDVSTDLDTGWTGLFHNFPLPAGGTLRYCLSGCDTSTSPVCDAQGATAASGQSAPNGSGFGPPLPLVAGGVPLCVVNAFADPTLSATANIQTGAFNGPVNLSASVFISDQTKVCPRCGTGAVGSTATCDSGANVGQPCVVTGTVTINGSDSYSLSSDCPPGGGRPSVLAVNLTLTSGTTSEPNPCSGQPLQNGCIGAPCACGPGACPAGPPPGGGIDQCCCADDPTTPCFPATIERDGMAAPASPVWPDPTYPKSGTATLVGVSCLAATGSDFVDTIVGLPGPLALTVAGTQTWLP